MKTYAVLLVAFCAVSLVCANKIKSSSYGNEDNSDFSDQPESSKRGRSQHLNSKDESNIMSDTDEAWNPEATDVFPFRYKITKRLENSIKLSENPEVRENLMKYFEDKVKICRLPNAGINQVNKHCVGRLTGQMMLMIASAETDGTNTSWW